MCCVHMGKDKQGGCCRSPPAAELHCLGSVQTAGAVINMPCCLLPASLRDRGREVIKSLAAGQYTYGTCSEREEEWRRRRKAGGSAGTARPRFWLTFKKPEEKRPER